MWRDVLQLQRVEPPQRWVEMCSCSEGPVRVASYGYVGVLLRKWLLTVSNVQAALVLMEEGWHFP